MVNGILPIAAASAKQLRARSPEPERFSCPSLHRGNSFFARAKSK
jgi:hypothetical protein